MKSSGVLYSIFVIFILFAGHAQADGYNISGKILKPDGTHPESLASFLLEVLNSKGNCVLYREQIDNVDMRGGNGSFHVVLGSGTRQHPVADVLLEDIFLNDTTFTCGDGTTYTPTSFEERSLRISFTDNGSWRVFGLQPLKSVPLSTRSKTAESAKFLDSYLSTHLLRTNVNIRELSSAEAMNLIDLAAGTSSSYLKTESDPTVKTFAKTALPVCTTGQVLKSDGMNFSCVSALSSNPLPAGTTGQFLKHNGMDWTASLLSISDIPNLTTQLSDKLSKSQLPSNCGPSQTLSYSSVIDNWTCSAISLTLAGDVTGSHNAASVIKIRNVAVAATVPTSGQVLKYDGFNWAPAPDANSGGTVTNVTSGNSFITVTGGETAPVISANVGTAENTLAAGDDMRFSDARTPTGAAGGDLSSTYPSPTVTGIQGKPVDTSAGLADGDTLVYNSTTGRWVLKKANSCPAGWTLVNRGVPFCIKNVSGTTMNYYGSVDACADNAAELCSVNRIVNACKIGALGVGTEVLSSQYDGIPITVTCGAAYPTITYWSTDLNRKLLPICCRPTL